MSTFEIPLTPEPQIFTITLNEVEYQMTVKWCDPANVWVLDIADQAGTIIVAGIPLVTGIDLLAQFAYKNFGGQLIAFTGHDLDSPPTFENLGAEGHLQFVTT